MPKVAKWLRQTQKPKAIDSICDFGRYSGKTWAWICKHDSNWILWLITESRVLLGRELERELMAFLKNLTWEE